MGIVRNRDISINSALVLAAAAVSFHLALGLWFRNDLPRLATLSDIYLPIPNILAVIGLLYAAKRPETYGRKVKTAWMLMALAQISSVLANIIWAVLEFSSRQTPFPSLADGFYLAMYPLFILGILLLPAEPFTRRGRIKMLLEMSIVVISASLAFWVFLIEPTIQASQADTMGLALSLSYPVLDLLMLFAVVELLFRRMGSSNLGSLYILAAGMVVAVASDSAYLLQFLEGTYQSGRLVDTGLVAWYSLVWLAGISQGSVRRSDRLPVLDRSQLDRHRTWISYLPYISVCAAYLLLIWSNYHPLHEEFNVLYWSVGVIIGLLLLRQVMTLQENSQLYVEAREEIAERKRAQCALIESEERYRSVVEQASEIIFIVETGTWRILDANQAFKKLLGYTQEDLAALTLFDLVASARESIDQNIIAVYEYGHCFLPRRKYRRNDGSLIDVEVNINLIAYAGREVHCVVARDVTERIRAEEALQTANAYNRSLIEASLDPLVTIGPDGKITDVNAATEAVTGYTRDQLTGTDFSDYFTDPGRARAGYKQAFRDGKVLDYVLDLRHKDGHVTSVLYNASVYRNAAGQITGIFAAARDITERRKAEEARLESEGRFRTIFETALNYIIIKDREGRYVQVNPAMERLMGRPSSDLAGKTDVDLYGPEIGERIAELDSRIVLGEVIEDEITLPLRDDFITFHYVKAPMRDSSGQICGLYGIAQDMTAHNRDRARLTASLAEKEVLLREVHHRVKNNLQIISSLLSIQSSHLEDDQAIEVLRECQGRVRSMALIHENLYRSENLASVNFAKYIRSLIAYICRSSDDGARAVSMNLDLEEVPLNIDYAIPCGLIVNELVTNSLKHAFPEGRTGKICIELRSFERGIISLSVKDDGVGLSTDPDTGTPKSVGMGLQLVKALARQIKASLEIDGHDGAAFTIVFSAPAGEK